MRGHQQRLRHARCIYIGDASGTYRPDRKPKEPFCLQPSACRQGIQPCMLRCAGVLWARHATGPPPAGSPNLATCAHPTCWQARTPGRPRAPFDLAVGEAGAAPAPEAGAGAAAAAPAEAFGASARCGRCGSSGTSWPTAMAGAKTAETDAPAGAAGPATLTLPSAMPAPPIIPAPATSASSSRPSIPTHASAAPPCANLVRGENRYYKFPPMDLKNSAFSSEARHERTKRGCAPKNEGHAPAYPRPRARARARQGVRTPRASPTPGAAAQRAPPQAQARSRAFAWACRARVDAACAPAPRGRGNVPAERHRGAAARGVGG